MILVDIPLEDCDCEREKTRDILDCIELEYDVLLSLSVMDVATFNKYLSVEPFYQNVLRDGVILSA